jgi:membrane peptidoglycan carboxypeptidase
VVKEGCANAPTTIRNVGFFCDYVVNWLVNTDGISKNELTTGGLKVITTLDVSKQNTIQKRLWKTIPAKSPMTAIIPAVDPRTGDVLAMATSKRYGNQTSRKDNTHTVLPIFTSYTGFGASTYKLFPLLTALSTGIPSDWPLQTIDPYHPGCYNASPAGVVNGDATETYDKNETLASATAKSSNTYFVELADSLLSCNLQPIVAMAQSLGMNGLDQPSDVKHQTVAQTVVAQQRSQQLVLGDISTSPLEIAGAYAAVANDGKFNPPAPVLSVTTDKGQNLPVKRPTATQVVSPQVARQAVQILTGDTKAPGTSAVPFESWYAQNPSVVAGKTGTAVASPKETLNSTIWFVGMTPTLVAATELVDLDSPFAPSRGLPGETKPGTAYGDYASGVWLKAVAPVLKNQSWAWPDPDAVAGAEVPDLTGQTLNDAATMLKAAGYKMREFDKDSVNGCASSQPAQDVAYYAPQIAPKGSVITICLSSGSTQPLYVPPPPKPPKPPKPPAHNDHGHGNANGSGGNQPGGTTSGSPGPGSSTSSTPGPGNGGNNGGGNGLGGLGGGSGRGNGH